MKMVVGQGKFVNFVSTCVCNIYVYIWLVSV